MIRVVDVETTGMFVGEGAEVIELGWWDMEEFLQPVPKWKSAHWGTRFYSPDRPCPPEVRAVHHIHPAEYEHAPRFSNLDLEPEFLAAGVTHLAAHNAEYEEQFISMPDSIRWLCTYKAALRVWPDAPHHGNQSLMYWLGLDTELEEDMRMPPHRALPDAYVTAHILGRLLQEVQLGLMVAWTSEPPLMPTCPIGDHRGKKWADVPQDFLNWYALRAKQTKPDILWNVKRELERRTTERLRGDS